LARISKAPVLSTFADVGQRFDRRQRFADAGPRFADIGQRFADFSRRFTDRSERAAAS
jgi:hypothetical protein